MTTTKSPALPTDSADRRPGHQLGADLEQKVRVAVGRVVGKAASNIAAEVVKELRDDEAAAAIHVAAENSARAALEPPEAEVDRAELAYASLEAFVHDYIAEMYRREVSARGADTKLRWCPDWWRHGEAIARLEALWRAFEHLRLDAQTGSSVWWRDHADPHMGRLLEPDGPFKYCSPEKGHSDRLSRLPLVQSTASSLMFPDARTDEIQNASGIVLPSTFRKDFH